MNNNMAFCEACRKNVGYIVKEQQMEGSLRGECYHYSGKTACCEECKAELDIAEVNDYNLNALYEAYREKNEIISLDKILKIPVKYAIGKRPLSLLLGWGEQTFLQYCEGDLPTKQNSETLLKIYQNPYFYKKLLEENKPNLKSSAAYEKSKRAVDRLTGLIGEEETSKIDLAIGYLLNQCGDITPFALQKALYYIQGFYFAFYQRFLFREDCEAWIHGPVYREAYERYKNTLFDGGAKAAEFDISVFSASEKAILDSIIKNLCCYSGRVLEKFTQAEHPWLITRGNLPMDEGSERVICKDLIMDYFTTVMKKYNMLSPADIKEYSQRMFEKV